MAEEPFDFLFSSPGEARVMLTLTQLRDIRSALEQSLENHQELIAIISYVPEGEELRPSERRELDHHTAGAAEVQRLLDQLTRYGPDLSCEAFHA